MRHGVGVQAGVMIALCVASLPSGTTCPHLQHPGAVSVRAGGAGEDGLLGVANMVVSDWERERSCSVGIGRRRHWRLVLRGGRRKGKLEVCGQGEADAGAAPIQPTALERWLNIAPSTKAKLPTSASSLGERSAQRDEVGERDLGVFDEEDELMRIEEKEGGGAWGDLDDGDDAGFDAGKQKDRQFQLQRQQKQEMGERGRKIHMMGDDDDLVQPFKAEEEEEKRRGGAERRRKAPSSWSILSLIEEREADERRRQRRRGLGAVIQKAGDAKLRSGDARGACEVYLKAALLWRGCSRGASGSLDFLSRVGDDDEDGQSDSSRGDCDASVEWKNEARSKLKDALTAAATASLRTKSVKIMRRVFGEVVRVGMGAEEAFEVLRGGIELMEEEEGGRGVEKQGHWSNTYGTEEEEAMREEEEKEDSEDVGLEVLGRTEGDEVVALLREEERKEEEEEERRREERLRELDRVAAGGGVEEEGEGGEEWGERGRASTPEGGWPDEEGERGRASTPEGGWSDDEDEDDDEEKEEKEEGGMDEDKDKGGEGGKKEGEGEDGKMEDSELDSEGAWEEKMNRMIQEELDDTTGNLGSTTGQGDGGAGKDSSARWL